MALVNQDALGALYAGVGEVVHYLMPARELRAVLQTDGALRDTWQVIADQSRSTPLGARWETPCP